MARRLAELRLSADREVPPVSQAKVSHLKTSNLLRGQMTKRGISRICFWRASRRVDKPHEVPPVKAIALLDDLFVMPWMAWPQESRFPRLKQGNLLFEELGRKGLGQAGCHCKSPVRFLLFLTIQVVGDSQYFGKSLAGGTTMLPVRLEITSTPDSN